MQLEFPASMTGAFLLGLLLAFVGTVLLGIAVWRSHALPRWAGALWAAGWIAWSGSRQATTAPDRIG